MDTGMSRELGPNMRGPVRPEPRARSYVATRPGGAEAEAEVVGRERREAWAAYDHARLVGVAKLHPWQRAARNRLLADLKRYGGLGPAP